MATTPHLPLELSPVPAVSSSPMSKPRGTRDAAPLSIRLRGVRQNNLKDFDLDLPLGKLIVITGLSGSGKSSLAFDTLYAEGQRRYIETFSPYARQFFDRMEKPAVDRIENIPPAIAIEQRNAVRTTRSTVGTMTESCEYAKALWHQLSVLHCRQCGQAVRREPPQRVWTAFCHLENPGVAQPRVDTLEDAALPYQTPASTVGRADECLVTFDLPLSERLGLDEQLSLLQRQGFVRVLQGGRIRRVDEWAASLAQRAEPAPTHLTVVVDRLRPVPEQRPRFIEACEQAYHFGQGRLTLRSVDGTVQRAFSAGFHCAPCNIEYREPTPALFSFNHPVGACPDCKGFGRVIGIDPHLALPDRTRTLAGGVVKPWQTGTGAECQRDMEKAARRAGIPLKTPFKDLTPDQQRWVMEGEPDYDPDDTEKSWPRLWYGVKGYFRWLESKAYKMHVRVLLSRYRSYKTCPACLGARFNPDSLLHRLPVPPAVIPLIPQSSGCIPKLWAKERGRPGRESSDSPSSPRENLTDASVPMAQPQLRDARQSSLTLPEFYALPLEHAAELIRALQDERKPAPHEPLGQLLGELHSRLEFLVEAGLGYLTLDRATRTLSGGETERVNLTACLGSRLVNTLYVLDEPSVGLHPRDTDRLIRILQRLRDLGNTVVVVEHEAAVMRAADLIVDLGPGHGETGGHIVFQGPPAALKQAQGSLTADYLSGRRSLPTPPRRPVDTTLPRTPLLRLRHASRHNLQDFGVDIPLGRFVVVSGVSGSGKTTLVREILLPLLQSRLSSDNSAPETDTESNEGSDDSGTSLESSATAAASIEFEPAPLLSAAVLVDQTPLARTPRSNPCLYIGAFDHIRDLFADSPAARARGFAAGLFSFNSTRGRCERCSGAGYEKIEMQFLSDIFVRCPACNGRRYQSHVLDVRIDSPSGVSWSIADFLDAGIEEALVFLRSLPDSTPARRATALLQRLADIGLGYLRCGQPVNTLSGGECQRLKLATHLASHGTTAAGVAGRPTLFVFDEPTTGLHFEDVRILSAVFHQLVEQGHSVLVVEHNLDVIQQADWVIDLGPGAGDDGGRIVVCGPPEQVAAHPASHTGRFVRSAYARDHT